jgi:glycosyltransferase involved in cell wall biosynthesis
MVNLATEYATRELQDKILFCSLTKGGIAEKKIRDLGFQVSCLDLILWEKPLTSLLKLIRFLGHYSILMLITSGSEANLFGGIAGKLARARLIVTEEIGVRTNSRKQRIFIRIAYRIANFNFAVSKLARENLLHQRLVDPKKCIVSYAPLNLVRGDYKSVPFGDDVRLLYLGRIHPEKDIELLLSSLFQVFAAGQKNFKLIIVGARNSEEYNFLQSIVEKLQLESRVEIQYATSQPREFIDKCHFLVQSSRSEGMGYSVLEAISRNKPIISTDVGIVPEIIVDGIHGFVSKSHEQNSFVEVLSKALSIDAAKYMEMTESVSRIDLSFVETSTYLDLLDSLNGKLNR